MPAGPAWPNWARTSTRAAPANTIATMLFFVAWWRRCSSRAPRSSPLRFPFLFLAMSKLQRVQCLYFHIKSAKCEGVLLLGRFVSVCDIMLGTRHTIRYTQHHALVL